MAVSLEQTLQLGVQAWQTPAYFIKADLKQTSQ